MNEPAFPCIAQDGTYMQPGMTMRDYFAAKAMHAIMTDPKPLPYYEIAEHAYRVADEMIKARQS